MVIFKLLFLSYIHSNLYFSFYHTNSIDILYIVHKYKKKLESTNIIIIIISLFQEDNIFGTNAIWSSITKVEMTLAIEPA